MPIIPEYLGTNAISITPLKSKTSKSVENIWILWWRPPNNEGDGNVERAYEDEERANEDFYLVENHPTKNYFLDNILFYKSCSPLVKSTEDTVNIWVLWWQPLSGIGPAYIKRAYEEEVRANEDFTLIEDHPTRNYFLDIVTLYKCPTGVDK